MNAIIAKRYTGAIRVSTFDSYKLNVNGLLNSFVYQGKEFKYFRKTDFIADIHEQSLAQSGYYRVDQYILHMYFPQFNTLINLKDNFRFKYEKFIPAENGDIIELKIMNTDSPYDLYKYDKYMITHDVSNSYLINGKWNKLLLGLGASDVTNQGVYAEGFFTNHINGVNSINENTDKKKYVKVLTYCSLLVGMIDNDIFPILLDVGSGNVNLTIITSMVNNLKTAWQNNVILNNLNIEELRDYYNQLNSYYKRIFQNQSVIINYSEGERILLIMKILPASSLLLIGVPTKILALKSLVTVNTNLDNADEEFALKIVNSIDLNSQIEVNLFLGELINEKFPTGNSLPPYQENLYSILYHNIQNYKAFVQSTMSLFGDDFYTKDNRTRFVYAILILWTESKYNPYKNLTPSGGPNLTLIDNGTFEYDEDYRTSAIMNYESSKNWLGNFTDKYTFEFESHGNGMYYIIDTGSSWAASNHSYHLYQPITLLSYPSETDTSIQIPNLNNEKNGAIPIFFLGYIDHHGDMKDLNNKIGIFIDVVTTVSGIGNLAKLRHLRHLSKLGQVLVIFEGVQIAVGVINLFLTHLEFCNNSPFCKKLSTFLTFIEISALITDPIAIAKAKRAAREVVEEGVQNGWPSGMVDATYGATPKQKIQEIADIDIADYINDYVERGKKDLRDKIKRENDIFKSRPNNANKPIKMNVDHYTTAQMNEVLTYGASKGLSKEDSMGLLHQGCRVREDGIIPTVPELKLKMDNLVTVRYRKYPFTHPTRISFDNYAKNKVENVLDEFGLPKNDVYYTGSSITSTSSQSQFFDTDWAVGMTQNQMDEYVQLMKGRFEQMKIDGIITRGAANKDIKKMLRDYANTGNLNNRYIVAVRNNKKVKLEDVLSDELVFPQSTLKTDITPVVEGVNMGYPRIKYNF